MSLFSSITKINEFCKIPPPSSFILTPLFIKFKKNLHPPSPPIYFDPPFISHLRVLTMLYKNKGRKFVYSSIWEGNLATHVDVWSGIFATYSNFIIYLIWYFCYLDDKFPPIIGICHQINMYNVFEGNISHLSPFKTVPQYIFRFWSFLNDFLY